MRRDQRELIKVAQRNFRKYVSMREWGWFVIIQKTRPLVGQPNPEEELRLLEEKANATYGGYKEALDVTENLKGQMDELQADIKSLTKTLEQEKANRDHTIKTLNDEIGEQDEVINKLNKEKKH